MSAVRVPILTIDGPSGSGKGTISRAVARHAGWHLLDSGALYRLVALSGLEHKLERDDVAGHAGVAAAMDVRFGTDPQAESVLLQGREVSHTIRSEQMGQEASRVAAWPAVRTALLGRQRAFAEPPGLVADGRDMGTVVFPEAKLKIFLTASAEERARRRYNQLKEKGSSASLSALSREIAERDARDSSRAVAPLVPAADAERIDSTDLAIEAVIERVIELGRRRSLWA